MKILKFLKVLLLAVLFVSSLSAEEDMSAEYKCDVERDSCIERCDTAADGSEECYTKCDDAYEKCFVINQEKE